MKKLSILLLMLTAFLHAQTLEQVNGNYTYTKTINTPKKKKEIYAILKKWLTDNSLQYVIGTDDSNQGILSFDERLSLMHYNDTQSTFPSFTSTVEIKNRKVIYKAGYIVLQDNYGGMTNIKNDYSSLVKRITTSTSHISELKTQLNVGNDVMKKADIRKEIETENKKLNQLDTVNRQLTDYFLGNVDRIAKMLDGTYVH
ncbi:hypothetical protein [Chryseobacterium sp. ISL-6]|uniref:hypothetical protein n=1 Tax=Chryseobacterium sp. ISL-6 TaxID=2819143 RepID=UPI001BEACDA8|nr:hypothetical protein [Chryseobacterium sp. ISL-6]MBT2623684.1 hypothetical protein [Chryseobacterium sp. ISL-6]